MVMKMMNSYEKLLKLRCFSLADAAELYGNENTAKSAIRSLKSKSLLQSVKRDLYVIISMETKAPVSTPFEIASHITPSSCISHHTAFEYYGMTNQMFSDIFVSSKERFNSFSFDGRVYRFISSKIDEGIIEKRDMRVTDKERTLTDSVKDLSKIGGLEELENCISMITFLDEEKLLRYLSLYNNGALYKKMGYFMSKAEFKSKLSGHFFEECLKHSDKSVRYLYEDLRNEDSVYVKEWKLFVPAASPEEEDIDV